VFRLHDLAYGICGEGCKLLLRERVPANSPVALGTSGSVQAFDANVAAWGLDGVGANQMLTD